MLVYDLSLEVGSQLREITSTMSSVETDEERLGRTLVFSVRYCPYALCESAVLTFFDVKEKPSS